jgi:hypothetical protein
MAQVSIKTLEEWLAKPLIDGYVYAEIGRYKPFNHSTIRAAARRGYRVECKVRGRVYYVYPKAPAMPTDDQMLAALGPCGK